MTWTETHRYYAALQEIAAAVEDTGDLPWRAEYAEVFGGRDGLLLALRRRWRVMVEAQVERPYDSSGQPTEELRELAERNRGLVAVLGIDAGSARRVGGRA